MASTIMKNNMAAFVLVLLFLFDVSAARLLNREQWLLPVLQRGPVPSSARNPCSLIPGLSRGRCTLSNVDDDVAPATVHGVSSAFPRLNVDAFAAASLANHTQKQDSSSNS